MKPDIDFHRAREVERNVGETLSDSAEATLSSALFEEMKLGSAAQARIARESLQCARRRLEEVAETFLDLGEKINESYDGDSISKLRASDFPDPPQVGPRSRDTRNADGSREYEEGLWLPGFHDVTTHRERSDGKNSTSRRQRIGPVSNSYDGQELDGKYINSVTSTDDLGVHSQVKYEESSIGRKIDESTTWQLGTRAHAYDERHSNGQAHSSYSFDGWGGTLTVRKHNTQNTDGSGIYVERTQLLGGSLTHTDRRNADGSSDKVTRIRTPFGQSWTM